MLCVRHVSKIYPGGVKALSDVSLDVSKGVFGLLGPNGAGKSSLMRTLATLQRPDSGEITLAGTDLFENITESRRRIGYLPQDSGVYPRVSALEMLQYLAALKGIAPRQRQRQVEALLEKTNLAEAANRRLDTFSGGMRRRFGIASAFLGEPDLVIVDEPTAGLDPSERRRFQFLLAEAARDKVLILSSHIIEDLAGLCTDMALVNRGQVVAAGLPAGLIGALEGRVWQRAAAFEELTHLQTRHRLLSWRHDRGALVVRILSDEGPGDGFETVPADLEDLYAAHIQ